MAIDCEKCPLRKLELFTAFSVEELRFMKAFKTGEMEVQPGTHLLNQGTKSPQMFTALSGMALRYKTLEDGSRQVISFVFPGDFIGLQAAVMGEMGHSVEAVTDMTLCVFNRADMWNVFRTLPERGFALTHLAAIEEHFLGDALATVGQRPAYEKIAWAIERYHRRAAALGLTDGLKSPLPFKQQHLADALGLSLVHTNKTLARLKADKVAEWRDGTLAILDLDRLKSIAQVDETAVARPLI